MLCTVGESQVDAVSPTCKPTRNKSAVSVKQPSPPPPPIQDPTPPPKATAGMANKRAESAQRHWLTWRGTPKPESTVDGDWVDETVSPAMGGHPYRDNSYQVRSYQTVTL